jgi:hypothetical protein
MNSQALACFVFRQLQGKWKLDRILKSTNTSEPSGKCYGIASFTPRPVTKIPDHAASGELLYEESGDFEITLPVNAGYASPRLTFSRKYIWRLSHEPEPTISVWFAKPGTDDLDYLFHEQDLHSGSGSSKISSTAAARAHGSHLCVEDMYETDYRYDITNQTASENSRVLQWSTSHTVKGPKKDQLITTMFTRQDSD